MDKISKGDPKATVSCQVCHGVHDTGKHVLKSSKRNDTHLYKSHEIDTETLIGIVQTLHHQYLELNLPLIKEILNQLDEQYLSKDRAEPEIAGNFTELKDIVEMLSHRLIAHAREEDETIFPMLLEVEKGRTDQETKAFIEEIVEAHRKENSTMRSMLSKIKRLCGNFKLSDEPEEKTLNQLYLHLMDLEADMAEHSKKEMELYPRIFQKLGLDDGPLRHMMAMRVL